MNTERVTNFVFREGGYSEIRSERRKLGSEVFPGVLKVLNKVKGIKGEARQMILYKQIF